MAKTPEAADGAVEANTPASDTAKPPPTGPAGSKTPRTNARVRYFILKSLTVEDLEMSVKNGVWATQSHNETALNQAFEVCVPFLPSRVSLTHSPTPPRPPKASS